MNGKFMNIFLNGVDDRKPVEIADALYNGKTESVGILPGRAFPEPLEECFRVAAERQTRVLYLEAVSFHV